MDAAKPGFKPMEDFDVRGKRVLLRVDINSPIDPVTKKIVNDNRIEKSLPTLKWLLDNGAKPALIAHQGDTLDYQNLIPLAEHAEILSARLGRTIRYVDDVCGAAACEEVKRLKEGEAVLLGNLRYLCEEISTFEDAVKLKASQMLDTWLVRRLTPLFDLYINDAFSAAHRNCPSMVAFQEVLPSAAGPLFFNEVTALTKVMLTPEPPSVFLLGGAKISDAFGMLEQVLASAAADKILSCGVTGQVFRIAGGWDLGPSMLKFLKDYSLDVFIDDAARYLKTYPGKILMPLDFAYKMDGKRVEASVESLPEDQMYLDIGKKTMDLYLDEINKAGTVFVNGPAGVFEDELFEDGTKKLWRGIAEAPGYTVIGGGDSVSAAVRFTDSSKMNFVCTAGGAMVRFLSGKKLPLIEAMEKANRS